MYLKAKGTLESPQRIQKLLGTTLYPMSVKDKNTEYQRYADTYDLKFIFDDDIPQIDFYTVPRVDIFAKDSL